MNEETQEHSAVQQNENQQSNANVDARGVDIPLPQNAVAKNEDLPEISDALNEDAKPKSETVFNPVEEEAKRFGWKPKKDYAGNDTEWHSAKEFMDRYSLFAKIKNQGRDLNKLTDTIDTMNKMITRRTRTELNSKQSELSIQKREAIEEGNVDRVTELDRQLDNIKEESTAVPMEQSNAVNDIVHKQPAITEEVKKFMEKHSTWFGQEGRLNGVATNSAVKIDKDYMIEHPEWSETHRLKMVERDMQEIYPQLFTRDPVYNSGAVEKGTSYSTGKKKRFSINDFSNAEREAIITMAQSAGMDVQVYVDQLISEGIKPTR